MRTVVRRLTVETVTKRRKVVSTRAHLLMASHRKNDLPMGRRIAALAQSTIAWWNINPWLHLEFWNMKLVEVGLTRLGLTPIFV